MDEIAFYDKQVQFQEKLGNIQHERSKLEREFYKIVRCDKRLQSLRTTKLRAYWKQVCEREKHAQERNEELLRDFESLETKYNILHNKTESLRKMKKQYEEEITKQYPQWKQEMDYARAKRQLEKRGIDVKTKPDMPIPQANIHPILDHSSSQIQGPLFKLVPVSDTSVSLQPAHVAEKDEDLVSRSEAGSPLPDTGVRGAQQAASSASLQHKPKNTEVPPLDLPTSVDGDQSDTGKSGQNLVQKMPLALSPSSTVSSLGIKSPLDLPQGSFSYTAPVNKVKTVQVSSTNNIPQRPEPQQYENILDIISDDFTSDDSDDFIDNNDFIPEKTRPDTVGTESTQQPVSTSKSENVLLSGASSITSAASHTSPNKIVVPIPGIKDLGHQDNAESNLSESLTTETSPRTDAPLTSSAAYQALLKGHEMNLSSTYGASGFFEDDDLEEVLSPKDHDERDSDEDESEPDSVVKLSPVVHIPTASHHSESNETNREQNTRTKESKKKKSTKAPWDTDTEDESFDSRHQVVGGGPLDDDDFDFYD